MIIRVLAAAAIAMVPLPTATSVASAQGYTQDEKDAAYQLCYDEYVRRGFPEGQANVDCYRRVYGDEGGGGGSGPSGSPPPQRDCYGSYSPEYCNPYVQPK